MNLNSSPNALAYRLVSRNEGYIQNRIDAGVSDYDIATDLVSKVKSLGDFTHEEVHREVVAELSMLSLELEEEEWEDYDL